MRVLSLCLANNCNYYIYILSNCPIKIEFNKHESLPLLHLHTMRPCVLSWPCGSDDCWQSGGATRPAATWSSSWLRSDQTAAWPGSLGGHRCTSILGVGDIMSLQCVYIDSLAWFIHRNKSLYCYKLRNTIFHLNIYLFIHLFPIPSVFTIGVCFVRYCDICWTKVPQSLYS